MLVVWLSRGGTAKDDGEREGPSPLVNGSSFPGRSFACEGERGEVRSERRGETMEARHLLRVKGGEVGMGCTPDKGSAGPLPLLPAVAHCSRGSVPPSRHSSSGFPTDAERGEDTEKKEEDEEEKEEDGGQDKGER